MSAVVRALAFVATPLAMAMVVVPCFGIDVHCPKDKAGDWKSKSRRDLCWGP